jgi:cell shape-determining protein MreC
MPTTTTATTTATTTDKKTEQKPKTLTEKIAEINTNKFKSDKEKALAAQNTKLKQQIATTKSKRGPSASSRISGLSKLQPSMGQQFTKS